MNKNNNNIAVRWFYLAVSVFAMLFAGVLYAWSILKSPLTTEFGWGASELALNFTLAMSFFCIGGLLGAHLSKRAGSRTALITAGILSALGFILTASLSGTSIVMLYANVLTICAAAVTLLSVSIRSLPLCIAGLCLTGISYGACPTITAAFTSSFFGMKYFSTNMALMTFTVMGGSLIATLSNKILEITGGYTATFIMLLGLTAIALLLNFFIRKP